jgi:CHAT domain-containing protein/tetratricopeptide (TPR) repeat protein
VKSRCQRALLIPILFLASACATAPPDLAGPRAETSRPGVVLEEVGEGSALEKAGIRPGDLVFAWEREGEGEIRTVFDWSWVKTEQAPRGTLRLHGERSGAAVSFEVPRGLWDARTRPRMAADLLQAFTEGQRRIEAGDLAGGVALWDQLAQRVEPDLRSWILLRVGEAWSKGGQGDKARSALQTAVAEARDPQAQVTLWETLGESYQYANDMARAETGFRSALTVGETAWGESLQVAGTIARLGNILRLQGRLDEAEKLQARALEIRQRWAPDSLEVTDSLHQLFLVAWDRRDLEAMAELTRRAQIIQKQWPADTLAMADTLNDLALLAATRGRRAEAAMMLQRALAIFEHRSPESIPMATILSRLGWVTRELGDTESAEEWLQRALEIRERLAPESLGTAAILGQIAAIAVERGDLARAAELCQRALEIWGKAAPRGRQVAGSLNSLAIVARLRGDLDEAWSLHDRAEEILEKLAPGSLDMALTLTHLGKVAEARGELDLALDLAQKAHAIYERRVPGTIEEAWALRDLGRLYRHRGRPEQAARFLALAVDALESQTGRLGGSQDLQAAFRARHEEIYRDAIEVELERGHAAEAFHLVERSRARSFLTLLSERDLVFSSEVPDALERSRRDNATRHDQTLHKLAQWTPASGEEARKALHGELSRLHRERDEIAAEIRKASPRLAELRQPQPLDLAAARKVLDPGTLALSYSIGEEEAALFAVTREGGLRVEILPAGEESLRRDVESFLERIQSQEAPTDLARSLYRALIAPVADLVERSERVLILPDGPLHRLPFGALIRNPGGKGQYLAEWKPLHSALSLTVYGTLRASDREPGSTQLVAFGDPRYPEDVAPAGMGLRGFQWTALPYSRREVERIAGNYPGARLYLGEEATEEQAKSLGRDIRVLHFATHGHLDDRNPLDSALVLTIPEGLTGDRDNGLLQVWEIFESVRTDADLVVLSACESALGRELSGEGMIGLTRAFQYAGARSVVATLWDVADQTTAELMARFHHHLAAGLAKDEALRAAQIELIRRPVKITTASGQALETDASAPFFWAAFQLFGDWR